MAADNPLEKKLLHLQPFFFRAHTFIFGHSKCSELKIPENTFVKDVEVVSAALFLGKMPFRVLSDRNNHNRERKALCEEQTAQTLNAASELCAFITIPIVILLFCVINPLLN